MGLVLSRSRAFHNRKRKLNACCALCVSIDEINWQKGITELSGYCPIGDVYLTNHNGGRASLYQKRFCRTYQYCGLPHQPERVEQKIKEAEVFLASLHSSQLISPSQVTSVGSLEQEPAGTAGNRLTAPKRSQAEIRPAEKSVNRGAAGMGNHLACER